MARRPAKAGEQLVTFHVAGEDYAVAASAVREVVRPSRLTPVPRAPSSLLGLGNLRGAVLPVVSLGILLGKPGASDGRVIVLEGDQPVGVMVDDVSAVTETKQGRRAGSTKRIDLAQLVGQAFVAGPGKERRLHNVAVSAKARETVAESALSLLAFMVSGQEFALPLAQVEEVTRLPADITLIPKAEAVVIGTVARGGKLLPLLSLRHLLGLPESRAQTRPGVVIARVGQHSLGLAVDSISSILAVPENAIDTVPTVLTRGSGEARIQAICRLDGGKRLVSVLGSDQLLRGDVINHLQTDGEEEKVSGSTTRMETEQFLVFRIGDQDFGLPIGAVEEVAMLPDKLARLPRSPAFVQGMMNLRGQVVPVIDQRLRFERPAEDNARRRVIIVAMDDVKAGFAVDAVAEVLRVPTGDLRDAPELGNANTRVFDRVANLDADGRMVLIVDPRELLDRAERDLLAAMQTGHGAAGS